MNHKSFKDHLVLMDPNHPDPSSCPCEAIEDLRLVRALHGWAKGHEEVALGHIRRDAINCFLEIWLQAHATAAPSLLWLLWAAEVVVP